MVIRTPGKSEERWRQGREEERRLRSLIEGRCNRATHGLLGPIMWAHYMEREGVNTRHTLARA